MALDPSFLGPFLRTLLLTIFGVAFWASGFVVAHYVWERYRGEDD